MEKLETYSFLSNAEYIEQVKEIIRTSQTQEAACKEITYRRNWIANFSTSFSTLNFISSCLVGTQVISLLKYNLTARFT
jgi:hypothetical protein